MTSDHAHTVAFFADSLFMCQSSFHEKKYTVLNQVRAHRVVDKAVMQPSQIGFPTSRSRNLMSTHEMVHAVGTVGDYNGECLIHEMMKRDLIGLCDSS